MHIVKLFKRFCAPPAWDILHRFVLWRASDVRKAISEISLHGKIGLSLRVKVSVIRHWETHP